MPRLDLERACVFVDSENLRNTVNYYRAGTWGDDRRPPLHVDWGQFFVDLAQFIQADLLRAYWYVPEEPTFTNEGNHGEDIERPRRHAAIAELKELHQLLDDLASRWDRITIRRGGNRKFNVGGNKWETEKGIDVALAVDMVALAHTYDVAILVSGDADFVPAVRATKALGKTVALPRFLVSPANSASGTIEVVPGQSHALLVEADVAYNVEENIVNRLTKPLMP